MKIIPSIDLMEGQVVRLRRGDPAQATVYSENPIEIAKEWVNQGSEIIHIVDLDATLGQGQNHSIIKKIIESVDAKIQVGGGIRTVSQASSLLKGGAWRVILGTLAISNPDALSTLLGKFGSDVIAVALDYEDGRVKSKGWRSFTELRVLEALSMFMGLGATSFLMTSVERDGLLSGPDIETLSLASTLHDAEIIASGGIRNIQDIQDLEEAGVWGAIVGRALYDGKFNLRETYEVMGEIR